MKKNDPRRYRYSLHGDIKIDTRSNHKPRKAVGYIAERVPSRATETNGDKVLLDIFPQRDTL